MKKNNYNIEEKVMKEAIFIKNGRFFLVKRDKFETIERFNERGWFIANKNPNTVEEYDEAVRLSRIWINKNFGGLGYKQLD